MMKRIIILMAFITVVGCREENSQDTLLSQSDISLTWRGEVQLSYTGKDYQMAYNDKDIEYRVYDDKLTNWFIIKCSEKPTAEGDIIIADVSWTGVKSIKNFKEKEFKVMKVDEHGQIWLQNSSDKIGIIIKNLQ